jgi:hypothetical protein
MLDLGDEVVTVLKDHEEHLFRDDDGALKVGRGAGLLTGFAQKRVRLRQPVLGIGDQPLLRFQSLDQRGHD